MIPELSISTDPVMYRAAAVVAVLLTVYAGTRWRLGPHADWVETVRATAWPVLDPLVERHVGGPGTAYELGPAEHAARVDADPETIERWLWDRGFRRNVTSAFKTTADDRSQCGAWVYRGDAVADDRQADVMLFRAPNGQTDIYAHVEFSSALSWLWRDPTVLARHYGAVGYDPEAGGELVRAWLGESQFSFSR
jgi:hypothetical protein